MNVVGKREEVGAHAEIESSLIGHDKPDLRFQTLMRAITLSQMQLWILHH